MATGKNLAAFDLFRNAAGLKDVDINTPGSRHSSLLAIMSAGASRVMPEDELKAVVAQKMPAFSQERDCQQLIHDFYAKYGDSSKPYFPPRHGTSLRSIGSPTQGCRARPHNP